MKPQEVFDKVVAHLRYQGCKAEFPNPKPGCAYRGKAGTKCAVGCLIEDVEYAPWMEGQSLDLILSSTNTPNTLRDRLAPHRRLLSGLQMIHDSRSVGDWEWELAFCAAQHHVMYTPPHRMTE